MAGWYYCPSTGRMCEGRTLLLARVSGQVVHLAYAKRGALSLLAGPRHE